MKISSILFLILLIPALYAQPAHQNSKTMKLNAGIITEKIHQTKEFYTSVLDFAVVFENDFYLLMQTPNKQAQISFLQPNHPTQHPIFQQPFSGNGMYLTIEVENVDEVHAHLKSKGVQIEVTLRDEPWGDRHFAIVDPNGIGIDFVTYVDLSSD